MKRKKYILICFFTLFALACNDDFLEKEPVVSQSEASLKTADNFLTYNWRFYDCFSSSEFVQTWYHGDISSKAWGERHGDILSGLLTSAWNDDTDNPWRRRTVSVPSARNGGSWNYSYIRAVNILLRNIDGSEMTESEKRHWRSVGYFFFCYRYAEMISRFGDVYWVNHVLEDDGSDNDIIYGERVSRKVVADSILSRLQYAEKNININGDGYNTINKACVQALMSRFCLFEGTWRKYHGLGDEKIFLQECVRVSEELMVNYPIVDDNYERLLTSVDLSSRPGVILYKEYSASLELGNMFQRYERSTSTHLAMHRFTTDLYLVQSNGKPVTNPSNFERPDIDMYDEFRDRDPRLLMTVCPPYSQDFRYANFPAQTSPVFTEQLPRSWNTGANYERPGLDKLEYVKWLEDNVPGNLTKRLPVWQFQGTAMIWSVPNFPGTPAQQFRSKSGYICWRHYSLQDVPVPISGNAQGVNESDKPIFFIEEILLNAAEAAFELGNFNQDYANRTINKLRRRTTVNMPDFTISQIDASFDPSNPNDAVTPGRDPSVDPVLWEIRRERLIELMCLGSSWNDVRRWKKGDWYMNRPILGVKINKEFYKNLDNNGNLTEITPPWVNSLPLVNKDFTPATGTSGYISRFDDPSKAGNGWDDTFYFYPIPTYDLTLNDKLKQNPGWEKY